MTGSSMERKKCNKVSEEEAIRPAQAVSHATNGHLWAGRWDRLDNSDRCSLSALPRTFLLPVKSSDLMARKD